jgi:hypothetical protein
MLAPQASLLFSTMKRTFIVRKEGLPDIGKTVCFYFRAKETRDQFGNQVLAL